MSGAINKSSRKPNINKPLVLINKQINKQINKYLNKKNNINNNI